MDVLNSLHSNITFTVEVGSNKLPFLDVEVELSENDINTWVYRKKTNTNVVMNFHDVAPKSWKAGLVFCFLNRAYNVCSSSRLFEKEVRFLKEVFLRNSYSRSMFDTVFDKFMAKKNGGVPEKEAEEDQAKVVLKMPFFGNCSTVFVKNLCSLVEDKFDIQLRATYTSTKLQSCFQLKSPTPFPYLSNVVYRFNCVSNSGLFYIGQTARHLTERAREHLDFSDKNSAVADHVSSCSGCKNANLTVNDFQVIKKCRNKFQTKIFEALYIQKLHPTLNIQLSNEGSGYLLKVFR